MKFEIFLSIVICTGLVLMPVSSARRRSRVQSTVSPYISYDQTSSVEIQLKNQSTLTSETESNDHSTFYPYMPTVPTTSDDTTTHQPSILPNLKSDSDVFHQPNENSMHSTTRTTTTATPTTPTTPTTRNQSNDNPSVHPYLPITSTGNQPDDKPIVHPNTSHDPTSVVDSMHSPNFINENQSNGTITNHRNNSTEKNESESDESESDESDESSIELIVPTNVKNDTTSAENESEVNSTLGSYESIDQENITSTEKFVSFDIYAKIDKNLAERVKSIKDFIRSSDFKSFTPLPRSRYHMTIYSIYNSDRCDQIIKPIERWYNTTNGTIPKTCSMIPSEALEEENNKAMCFLKKDLNKTIKIKYASLNIGIKMISVTLAVEADSLRRIRNARKKFAEIYDHPDLALEPIKEKLYIRLAHGRRSNINLNHLNKLNDMVRPFIGAKLMIPSIYLDNGNRYIEFEGKTDCSSYDITSSK